MPFDVEIVTFDRRGEKCSRELDAPSGTHLAIIGESARPPFVLFPLVREASNFQIVPGDLVVEFNGISTTGQTVAECSLSRSSIVRLRSSDPSFSREEFEVVGQSDSSSP